MTPRRAAALGRGTEGGRNDDLADGLIGSHDTNRVNILARLDKLAADHQALRVSLQVLARQLGRVEQELDLHKAHHHALGGAR